MSIKYKKDGAFIDIPTGGGSANIIELTQAEYDALPESKNTDDTMYLIKDAGGEGGGSGDGITEITQEQWDAMSEEERNKGCYFISDAPDGVSIGELNNKVNDLNENLKTIDIQCENTDLATSIQTKIIDVYTNSVTHSFRLLNVTENGKSNLNFMVTVAKGGSQVTGTAIEITTSTSPLRYSFFGKTGGASTVISPFKSGITIGEVTEEFYWINIYASPTFNVKIPRGTKECYVLTRYWYCYMDMPVLSIIGDGVISYEAIYDETKRVNDYYGIRSFMYKVKTDGTSESVSVHFSGGGNGENYAKFYAIY